MQAKKYLKRYHTDSINGKGAEDFAMECIITEKTPTFLALKRNIIDEARSYWGRKDRVKKVRKFVKLYSDAKRVFNPPSELEVSEVFDDFTNSLPSTLKPKLQSIATALASGKEKKQIAKELGVSQTRVTQLIDELTEELAKDSEWKNKLKIFQKRNPNSSERRRNMQF